jgi:signal transduction histidine kinase
LIEQVIVHLAINSSEAMPDGGTLTISTESNISSGFQGRFESITISDNGCGMDEEQQRRIFEPFFSTKEKGKNSGLGLSTVFKIIEQHNGKMIVESAVGQGTKITVLLPKESEDDPTAKKTI